MSETLELSSQVQKAIAKLDVLIKEKSNQNFDDQKLQLQIVKELLKEQDLKANGRIPHKY